MDVFRVVDALFAHAGKVGLAGTFQFIFDGFSGLWFQAGADGGKGAGVHPKADLTLELSSRDFLDVMAGSSDIEDLFASGRLKVTGNLGLATLLPQLIDVAMRGVDYPDLKANHRYPAPTRCSEQISRSQPALRTVLRRASKDLSAREFHVRYAARGIPVVILDALVDWPLFNMTREAASGLFAGLRGVTRNGNYLEHPFSTDRDFKSVLITDYIASFDAPGCPTSKVGPPPYMGNNILPAELVPYIRYPSYFDLEKFLRPRIWVGPKGTLTPLHRDDCDNFFAQLWGSKVFTLAAPHHKDDLGAWSTSPVGGLDGSDIDPRAPDFAQFPDARKVVFINVVLNAGDLLFLPEGWFHQVESLSASLSVNFWTNSGRG
jgi:putative sterol carrier protein